MSFLKKAKFRIFKLGNVSFKDQAEDPKENPAEEASMAIVSEPKPEPEAATSQWEALKPLESEWSKALEQGSSVGFPKMVRLTQDGQPQYFYVLKNLGQQTDQETATFKFRALRSDMKIYDVEQKVRLMSFGPIVVSTQFKEVSPEESGLNPSELLQLIQTILKGETPL